VYSVSDGRSCLGDYNLLLYPPNNFCLGAVPGMTATMKTNMEAPESGYLDQGALKGPN
jgi:hypothetical protein